MDSQNILHATLTEIRCMSKELVKLRKEISVLSERLSELEKNNKEVGTILTKHIGFVDDKYEHYRGSLDYIKDKVNYLNYLNPLRYLSTQQPSGFPVIEDSEN